MFGFDLQTVILIGVVALLLFGQRLPDVARTAGKYYSEFRRHLSDIQSQMNLTDIYSPPSSSSSYSSYSPATSSSSSKETYDDYEAATAPKFEPPPAAPAAPKMEPAASKREPISENK